MRIPFFNKKALKEKYKKVYYKYLRTRILINKLLISDKRYIERKFINKVGVKPDLKNPRRFNEHITKICMTEPDDLITQCVDKYAVREYVKTKVGGHILNKLIGIYSNFNEIIQDIDKFPQQFVLKATHGSHWNYICKDKSKVDFTELKILINHWLRSNCYYLQRVKVYKNVPPRIICEKYLEDESVGLIDYKVHCFYGQPKFINVIMRYDNKIIKNTYDLEWKYLDIRYGDNKPNDKEKRIKKPELYDQLIYYSEKLSEEFTYVRVDFYIVIGKIIFGELTFTEAHGANPLSEADDLFLGKYFND